MPIWLLLIILSLATYRLTRLTVRDEFPPIRWIRCQIVWRGHVFSDAWEQDGCWQTVRTNGKIDDVKVAKARAKYSPRWEWLADLVTCHWCASGWISLVLVLGTAWWFGMPAPVLAWFAVWAAGAWLANIEDRAAGTQPVTVEAKDHAP